MTKVSWMMDLELLAFKFHSTVVLLTMYDVAFLDHSYNHSNNDVITVMSLL